MIPSQRCVYELGVGRRADQDGVTVGKFGVFLVEFGDFGGTNERKILGPPEVNGPLTLRGRVFVRQVDEFFAFFDRNDGLFLKSRKGASYGQNSVAHYVVFKYFQCWLSIPGKPNRFLRRGKYL
jgi:hypothetical protein